MRKQLIAVAVLVSVLALSLTGCSDSSANQKDSKGANEQLNRYLKNQPVPLFDWSQYRQTLTDVEAAEVNGTATTTFFFNMGVRQPTKVCSSLGFPVPSTAQLTNPTQAVDGQGNSSVVVNQLEPNGVYTGPSSGTYVVCIAPNGTKFPSYWEGDVDTEGGAAHWDNDRGIVLDGSPTVVAKTK